MYPSGDVVPANQLRMYLHFSAPMDWRSGYDHLTLLDDHGEEVVDAFLPLDADFWNDDRTRYTVFFDPGRVKRGILPNKQMGRALERGQAVHARRQARVARRPRPAVEGRVQARVPRGCADGAAAVDGRLEGERRQRRAPASRCAVTFPDPLDHGLLRRALGVARDGAAVEGEIAIEARRDPMVVHAARAVAGG